MLRPTNAAAFATYDIRSSTGLLSGPSFIRPDVTFATTLGGLNLTSAGATTFSAQVSPVPEPATFAVLGLPTLALLRRKRA